MVPVDPGRPGPPRWQGEEKRPRRSRPRGACRRPRVRVRSRASFSPESPAGGNGVSAFLEQGVVEARGGLDRVVDQIHSPHRFLGQPGTEQLIGGSPTRAWRAASSVLSALVETLLTHDEQLADAREGIGRAARCPRVSCWTRRRTSSTIRLATWDTRKRSATLAAWTRREKPGPVGRGQVHGDDRRARAPALRAPAGPSPQLTALFPSKRSMRGRRSTSTREVAQTLA